MPKWKRWKACFSMQRVRGKKKNMVCIYKSCKIPFPQFPQNHDFKHKKIDYHDLPACLGRLVSVFHSSTKLTIVNCSTPNMGVYAKCVNPEPKNLVSI